VPAYTVSLDAFHGPIDLLLYLVRRQEVDILDIPIAQLADQFIHFLEFMQELDVELAGDFLVMASTLMEIKVRSLLPQDETPTAEEADPRRELVRQLLEYRKFKDAAVALEHRAEQHSTRVARQLIETPPEPGAVAVRPVELWDLVSAFARLMRETQTIQTTTISVDDTPQHVYEEQIRDLVNRSGRVNFRDLFTPPFIKVRLIGLFLAVLELIKLHHVEVEPSDDFTEIWLKLPSPPAKDQT
jgi:segregation and condensation protein A